MKSYTQKHTYVSDSSDFFPQVQVYMLVQLEKPFENLAPWKKILNHNSEHVNIAECLNCTAHRSLLAQSEMYFKN